MAIVREQCKIGGKFVLLITNIKSHLSFQLVPNSVTLNDIERRNGRYIALSFQQITTSACKKETSRSPSYRQADQIDFITQAGVSIFWSTAPSGGGGRSPPCPPVDPPLLRACGPSALSRRDFALRMTRLEISQK